MADIHRVYVFHDVKDRPGWTRLKPGYGWVYFNDKKDRFNLSYWHGKLRLVCFRYGSDEALVLGSYEFLEGQPQYWSEELFEWAEGLILAPDLGSSTAEEKEKP